MGSENLCELSPDQVISVLALSVSIIAIVVSVGIGYVQSQKASTSMQVGAVATIIAAMDDRQSSIIESDDGEDYLELLMNEVEFYSMLVNKKLITREDLREYLEDNFVDLYELAKEQFVGGGYLEEEEFETTYKESKTLYDTKKTNSEESKVDNPGDVRVGDISPQFSFSHDCGTSLIGFLRYRSAHDLLGHSSRVC